MKTLCLNCSIQPFLFYKEVIFFSGIWHQLLAKYFVYQQIGYVVVQNFRMVQLNFEFKF